MALARADLLHVAKLARLQLHEAEIEPLLADLDRIVSYVESLSEVDTSGVEPTSHFDYPRGPLRSDNAPSALTADAVLSAAPRHDGRGFAVPAFVDEG